MDISEEIEKLNKELNENFIAQQKAEARMKEIKVTIRKLETQKKKFEAILGEGQKGAAE